MALAAEPEQTVCIKRIIIDVMRYLCEVESHVPAIGTRSLMKKLGPGKVSVPQCGLRGT